METLVEFVPRCDYRSYASYSPVWESQRGRCALHGERDSSFSPPLVPMILALPRRYRSRNHGHTINGTEGLGLLIADEGHRLKNSAETKTTRALKACPAAMRLVLVRLTLWPAPNPGLQETERTGHFFFRASIRRG